MGKRGGDVNMMEIPSYTGLSQYNRNTPPARQARDHEEKSVNPDLGT